MDELVSQGNNGPQGNTGYNNANRSNRSRGKSGITSWGFRLAFFAIYFLFKLSTCNSDSVPHYDIQNLPITYQYDSLNQPVPQLKLSDTIPVTAPAHALPSLLLPPAKSSSKLDSILRKYKLKDTTAP
jgi:hypothetical protein